MSIGRASDSPGTAECRRRIAPPDLAACKHRNTEVLRVLPLAQSITTFVVVGSPKDDRDRIATPDPPPKTLSFREPCSP